MRRCRRTHLAARCSREYRDLCRELHNRTLLQGRQLLNRSNAAAFIARPIAWRVLRYGGIRSASRSQSPMRIKGKLSERKGFSQASKIVLFHSKNSDLRNSRRSALDVCLRSSVSLPATDSQQTSPGATFFGKLLRLDHFNPYIAFWVSFAAGTVDAAADRYLQWARVM